jgi:hypothetical protein
VLTLVHQASLHCGDSRQCQTGQHQLAANHRCWLAKSDEPLQLREQH